MQLLHRAAAGTLESSDCCVTVEPAEGLSLEYTGANSVIFRERTERLAAEILEKNGVSGAKVAIQDQGAIEITIKARLETALLRAARPEEEEAI